MVVYEDKIPFFAANIFSQNHQAGTDVIGHDVSRVLAMSPFKAWELILANFGLIVNQFKNFQPFNLDLMVNDS